ncbi:DUF547 domain-containing protein [Methyloprofundus sp.]|uniref:DUF547 domain-containing protein n=1 Tax=Methyloprofundus sp. TaxID=2020875 RepID=UPI003D0DF032
MKNSALKVIAGLLLANNVAAVEPDWKDYASVLGAVKQGEKHGTPLAIVDYAALKKSGLVDKVYQQISAFPVESLSGRQETLAFYINTYNILALKTVVDHWPLDSIKDVGSIFSPVWGKDAGTIGGKTVSLDDIENKIIRPMGEPRIHLAIVCASVSCPDLRNVPYTASTLNKQLDAQANAFLRNDKKGLYIAKDEIVVSKIFKWFKQDFDKVGGVDTFIRGYRPDLPVSYPIDADIDYDWSINALNN